MWLCSEGHEEVYYEGRDCPVCSAIEEINAAQDEITDLEAKIKHLETMNHYLRSNLEEQMK